MFTFFSNKFNTEALFNEEKSHTEVFSKKGVLKYFAKFILKHKPAACKFILKRLRHRCFPAYFAKLFFGTPVSYRAPPVAASERNYFPNYFSKYNPNYSTSPFLQPQPKL